MTAGVQCDTCRTFSPQPSPAWLYVVRTPSENSFLSMLGGSTRDEPGTFCSVRCLAEWAYVQMVTGEAAMGKEPGHG